MGLSWKQYLTVINTLAYFYYLDKLECFSQVRILVNLNELEQYEAYPNGVLLVRCYRYKLCILGLSWKNYQTVKNAPAYFCILINQIEFHSQRFLVQFDGRVQYKPNQIEFLQVGAEEIYWLSRFKLEKSIRQQKCSSLFFVS